MSIVGKKRAASVRYPNKHTPTRFEFELSESGARKGIAIGILVSSKFPHPLAVPAGAVIGAVLGAIFGKAD
ncbi:TPA: hypothetical protein I7666_21515 [Vibrio vulnificus]|nr:hypothetical protein [Vibrio vulnificus]